MRIGIQQLKARRQLGATIAASGLVALVCALLSVSSISLLPPKLEARRLQVSAAATHILIDTPRSTITDRTAYPQHFDSLTKRAELLGRIMAAPPVLDRIARRAGVPADELGSIVRTTANVPVTIKEPGSEQRSSEILESKLPYRLEIQARPTAPVIDVYTQAPSTDEAERLAAAAIGGLRSYLDGLAASQDFDLRGQVRLAQLGPARGGVVASAATVQIAVITFALAFVLAFLALQLLGRFVATADRIGAPAEQDPESRGTAAAPLRRRPAIGSVAHSMMRLRPPPEEPRGRASGADGHAAHADDWPRTTRVLPWMLAGFIAILWLVPFNSIELSASLPIDLKFDRLVLPFIIATWVLALAIGGRAAPRLRWTWIHAAVGAFMVCAFLSVILNAGDLSNTLELEPSIKRLPLLLSYLSLFVMIASVIRKTEVPAFLIYILILAVICALGIVWEYRFEYNLFYSWADKILPGIFQVGVAEAGAVDGLGRRLVRGPAALGLEAVAMLSMALPIALVGLLQSPRWRTRVLYALAASVIVAATFATYRKSAMLAPLSVVLTLAYFRRQELLKLAPLALVLVVVVHILSPGAIGSTTSQLDSERLGAATVSDRAIDYDAIRPDLWTNLALGRGWGSYDHTSYRILDSEILHRTVEMGILGLVAFLMMMISVLLAARGTIRSRHPRWSPPALIGAASAMAFLTVSTLFDAMSFPHAPYIFLCMAGLVAVIVARADDTRATGPMTHGHPSGDRLLRRRPVAGAVRVKPPAREGR